MRGTWPIGSSSTDLVSPLQIFDTAEVERIVKEIEAEKEAEAEKKKGAKKPAASSDA